MIVFTNHAKDKLQKELKKLGVTEETVMSVINDPDELLYDSQTGRFVALGPNRRVAAVYEKSDGDILVITVIYSSVLKETVDARRRSGRWI